MNIESKVLYLYMLQQSMTSRNFDLILHFLLVYLICQYSDSFTFSPQTKHQLYYLLVDLVESKIG